MNKNTFLWLAGTVFVLIVGFTGERAMAQYTEEFIFCLDGSSPEACRDTEIPPNEDGVVIWGRDYGARICAGVGIKPQETDCFFTGASYGGFGCQTSPFPFSTRVLAGDDMAIACGDISPLPNGNYSAGTRTSSCFMDKNPCANFIIVDIAPSGSREDKD